MPEPFKSWVAEVKHYEVVSKNGAWGTLRCPKCKNEFKVKRKEWKECRPHIGRSCPYCFRTSAKPGTKITEEAMRGPKT